MKAKDIFLTVILILLLTNMRKKQKRAIESATLMMYSRVLIETKRLGIYTIQQIGNEISKTETNKLSLKYGNPSSLFFMLEEEK